jgi:hypothetical protein
MGTGSTIWTIISSVGLSGLISTCVTLWLTGRREHHRWVLDNKKAEWKELLFVLAEVEEVIPFEFATSSGPDERIGRLLPTITKAIKLMQCSVFIRTACYRLGAISSWREYRKQAFFLNEDRSTRYLNSNEDQRRKNVDDLREQFDQLFKVLSEEANSDLTSQSHIWSRFKRWPRKR